MFKILQYCWITFFCPK